MTERIRLTQLLDNWARTWEVPNLAAIVEIRFSNRLERSLGRCKPSLGLVTLAAELESGDQNLLAEVLCHEVAHIAAYRLHGARAAAHGKEWQALVRAAGFEPRAISRRLEVPPARRRRKRRYEHRCEVCQSVQYGGRPVPQWRCAECLAAGLDGALTIIPVEPSEDTP